MNMTALTWIELPKILLLCLLSVITWGGPGGSCGQLLVELSRSLPAREGRRTWVSSSWHPKSSLCVGGFLQLQGAPVYRQGKKEDAAGGREAPGVCWSCSAVSQGCFSVLGSTGCSHCWRRSLWFLCSPRMWHFIISSCLWRFTAFCLGKCSTKTYRATTSCSDSCDTEVKKNTWVDSLEKRYLCHLKTW